MDSWEIMAFLIAWGLIVGFSVGIGLVINDQAKDEMEEKNKRALRNPKKKKGGSGE